MNSSQLIIDLCESHYWLSDLKVGTFFNRYDRHLTIRVTTHIVTVRRQGKAVIRFALSECAWSWHDCQRLLWVRELAFRV